VRTSCEFRETKVLWNLVNDLPEFKLSQNIAPARDHILAVVRSDADNAGRLMYCPLIPSFAKAIKLEYRTRNATPRPRPGSLRSCMISRIWLPS